MDIKIKAKKGAFKYRVSGIITNKDKILVVKICDNDFYCLPGGHVKLGESTLEALKREIKEETGYDIKNPKLIAVVENFFHSKINNNMHELGFYYSININEDIEKENYIVIEKENDAEIKLEFKWIGLKELCKINFQPAFLKEKLINNDNVLVHKIIKI